MQKWEYMIMRAEFAGPTQKLLAIHSDGQALTLNEGGAGPRQVFGALGELGNKGWELVTLEVATRDAAEHRDYWLKRPTPAAGEPQIY